MGGRAPTDRVVEHAMLRAASRGGTWSQRRRPASGDDRADQALAARSALVPARSREGAMDRCRPPSRAVPGVVPGTGKSGAMGLWCRASGEPRA